MDNGLRRIAGRRLPTAVLDVDVPDLARAITSALRGQASPQVFRLQGKGYVRLVGRGLDVTVPEGCWRHVLTHIRDEALTVAIHPVEAGPLPVDTTVRLSTSTVDANDPLYQRVIGLLEQLFTTKVPT